MSCVNVMLSKVADYIKTSNITIDDNLLQDFPIQSNKEFYNFFKPATNLTLDQVNEELMNQLKCLLFTNCSELTLRNMEITNDFNYLPQTLSKLALVDFKIEQIFLKKWLEFHADRPALEQGRNKRKRGHTTRDHI